MVDGFDAWMRQPFVPPSRADLSVSMTCELNDHRQVRSGTDTQTGERYSECACGAEREYYGDRDRFGENLGQ